MRGKAQDGYAISILWKKCCQPKNNTLTAAQRFWYLVKHEQYMRQCRIIGIARRDMFGG
jgi:hypothetical protein